MRLWIVGFACFVALQRSFVPPVDASPRTFPGFASHRPGGEQPAQFAEGVRDWFRNVKNRFFGGGGGPDALPPAEAGRLMMELENEDPQVRRERQRKNPGGFFLDIANLSFDPDRDWGFRLGQWYFIRKVNDGPPPPTDWKSSSYPDWPTMVEEKGGDEEFPRLPPLPPPDTLDPFDITTRAVMTTDETSAEVTEAPATSAEKTEADNETRGSPESMRSAEVLIPSE